MASLWVVATVTSHGSRGGFVVDAGAKILGKDVAPFIAGLGPCRLGRAISRVSRLPRGSRAARRAAAEHRRRGPRLPNHVCPVVDHLAETFVVRGGQVVDVWPVDARGRFR